MAVGGATKTSVATKKGLNFKTASRHLDILLGLGHLDKQQAQNRTLYTLTGKGEDLLKGLHAIRTNLAEIAGPKRPATTRESNPEITDPTGSQKTSGLAPMTEEP